MTLPSYHNASRKSALVNNRMRRREGRGIIMESSKTQELASLPANMESQVYIAVEEELKHNVFSTVL